jgi:rRNA maturation RNase YbeY
VRQISIKGKFKPFSTLQLKKQLQAALKAEDVNQYKLHFYLIDDESLLNINRQFLQHDYYTDIITFDYSIPNIIVGEIYISTTRVKENATELKIELKNELLRIMAHGTLHLLGYKDKSKTEKKKMTEAENRWLHIMLECVSRETK